MTTECKVSSEHCWYDPQIETNQTNKQKPQLLCEGQSPNLQLWVGLDLHVGCAEEHCTEGRENRLED